MQLKRSFERAVSHCDVIIVVVIPELFTNVVCTVARLYDRVPTVWFIHGGVTHVDDGYTCVSQNIFWIKYGFGNTIRKKKIYIYLNKCQNVYNQE